MSFTKFLEQKPLYYKKIDYDRMPRIWQKIKKHFNLPRIIHIIGTNGKGSTGRFLAYFLYKSGFKIGHYSSPHVFRFNERIWLNGGDADDKRLQEAHQYLLSILEKEDADSLSYFEYTTLMAIYLFQDCEYAVMEAGMGGEFDATAVFEKDATLLTTVDYDHIEFLGEEIKDIAFTKLNGVKNDLFVGYQIHDEVKKVANELSKKKGFMLYEYDKLIDKKLKDKIKVFIASLKLPRFFEDNLSLCIAYLKDRGFEIDFEFFEGFDLVCRAQRVSRNVIVDVGHNPLSAEALKEHLKGDKLVLIYNSFKDKNYKEILDILKPIVKRVEILPIESDRAVDENSLQNYLKELCIDTAIFKKIDPDERYLVYGSFSVVQRFLEWKIEK